MSNVSSTLIFRDQLLSQISSSNCNDILALCSVGVVFYLFVCFFVLLDWERERERKGRMTCFHCFVKELKITFLQDITGF